MLKSLSLYLVNWVNNRMLEPIRSSRCIYLQTEHRYRTQSNTWRSCPRRCLNTDLEFPIITVSSCPSRREPVPGAGGDHPDQAERAHGGPPQSRRHRQHHHAGGHSLWNELLHGTVDPPQEIQTHHQHLLRRFALSKKKITRTSKVSDPLRRSHVYTFKSICIHIWAKWSSGRWRERERLPVPAPPKCRTLWRIFLYFIWLLPRTFLLFQF